MAASRSVKPAVLYGCPAVGRLAILYAAGETVVVAKPLPPVSSTQTIVDDLKATA